MTENNREVFENAEMKLNEIKNFLNNYVTKKIQISMLNEDIKDSINGFSEKTGINKKFLRKIANMVYKINCKKDKSIIEEEKNILSFIDKILMESKN